MSHKVLNLIEQFEPDVTVVGSEHFDDARHHGLLVIVFILDRFGGL